VFDSLRGAIDAWRRRTLEPHVGQHPEIRSPFLTGSHEHEVKAVYTPLDARVADDQQYAQVLGLPGEYPFTRGRTPSGHRSIPWKLGFYSGFGDPAGANARIRQLAAAGTSYVTLAMDLPSQCGFDPDHPLAAGEVGRVGVSIASLRDAEGVLEGVPLERVGTGTVGNCIEPIMVGMFSAVAARHGLDAGQVHITLQNDPLKEYTGRGTYIIPIEPAVDLAADVTEFCVRHRPLWIPQYACTTQLRWGGVTASEEMAFGIANFMAYVDRAIARGLAPEQVVPRLEGIHMTIDNDFFEEVAKLRAMRRLWARVARERYKTDDPRVLGLKLTIFTGAHRMTAQQPLNNITRNAVHVLAALLGGVERISTPAYEEALALPTEESTRIANLTKIILLYENGLTNTVDPLGGSYYVEHLTDELERKADRLLSEVEAMGGAIRAIEKGFYETAMLRGMQSQQREIERRERMVVGVNAYELNTPDRIELFEVDEHYESTQRERVQQLRRERDNSAVRDALRDLGVVLRRKKSGDPINSVPAFAACVEAYATIGEMCDVMRDVYGEYRPQFAAATLARV
jgi:methylmalonyl-CoA mutase N-terminal domain/subunit